MTATSWPNGFIDRRGNTHLFNYADCCPRCDLEIPCHYVDGLLYFPLLQQIIAEFDSPAPAPKKVVAAVDRADQPEQLQLFDTRDHITFS